MVVISSVASYLIYLDVGLFDRGGNGDHALIAKKLLESGTFNAWFHPPLSFLVLAFAFKVGGYGEFVARFSALVFFVFGGYFVFRLGRCLHSSAVGLVSSYLYFFSPLLMDGVFSSWMDAMLTSFVVASVCFMCEYLRFGRLFFLTWGGVFAGLAVLTKETALVLFPVYFFVFRRDVNLRRLLFIMAFFAGVWLVSYELLNSQAHYYTLLLPVKRLMVPDNHRDYGTAFSNFFEFVHRFGAGVFVFSLFGGAWLLRRDRRLSLLPVAVSLLILLVFSASQTKYLKYFFPAVPFLFVFAAAAFAGLFSVLSRRRPLLFFGFLLGFYLLGSYGTGFFDRFEDRSRGWVDNPRVALRDFVLNSTAPSDSIAVVDTTNPAWLEFYTGRRAYSVPVYYPEDARVSLVGEYSPRYLVVRGNPGVNVSVFSGNCGFFGFVGGRLYNYSVYSCVWP